MKISAIVAATENDVIAKNGIIPWRLPADFAYLRKTVANKPLIMGRGTYEFIHKKWAGSLVVVISRNLNYQVAEGQKLVSSIKQALDLKEIKNADEVFIFGGQSIYEEALPYTDRIYLTRIHATLDGDRFFKYNPDDWVEVGREAHKKDSENPYDYDFIILERKKI
jgi:dihydrofolate reductase